MKLAYRLSDVSAPGRGNMKVVPGSRLTPVQQQLLGGAEDLGGDHAWGHYPQDTPLYG